MWWCQEGKKAGDDFDLSASDDKPRASRWSPSRVLSDAAEGSVTRYFESDITSCQKCFTVASEDDLCVPDEGECDLSLCTSMKEDTAKSSLVVTWGGMSCPFHQKKIVWNQWTESSRLWTLTWHSRLEKQSVEVFGNVTEVSKLKDNESMWSVTTATHAVAAEAQALQQELVETRVMRDKSRHRQCSSVHDEPFGSSHSEEVHLPPRWTGEEQISWCFPRRQFEDLTDQTPDAPGQRPQMSVKDVLEMTETQSCTTAKQHERSETDLWRLVKVLMSHVTLYAWGRWTRGRSRAVIKTLGRRCQVRPSMLSSDDVDNSLSAEPERTQNGTRRAKNTSCTERYLREQSGRTCPEEAWAGYDGGRLERDVEGIGSHNSDTAHIQPMLVNLLAWSKRSVCLGVDVLVCVAQRQDLSQETEDRRTQRAWGPSTGGNTVRTWMCVRGNLTESAESENEAMTDRRRCFIRTRSLALDGSTASEESGARSAKAPTETSRKPVGTLFVRPGRPTALHHSEKKSSGAVGDASPSTDRSTESKTCVVQLFAVAQVVRDIVVDATWNVESSRHMFFQKLACRLDLRCSLEFTCRHWHNIFRWRQGLVSKSLGHRFYQIIEFSSVDIDNQIEHFLVMMIQYQVPWRSGIIPYYYERNYTSQMSKRKGSHNENDNSVRNHVRHSSQGLDRIRGADVAINVTRKNCFSIPTRRYDSRSSRMSKDRK